MDQRKLKSIHELAHDQSDPRIFKGTPAEFFAKAAESLPPLVHCWADYRATLEVGSDEWVASYNEKGNATCMLPSGHTGEHRWTPDDKITVTFKELLP